MAELQKVAWIALVGLTGCGANVSEPAPAPEPNRGPIGSGTVEQAPNPSTENGANPAPAEPVDPTAAVASIDENLARLRALDIFEVGDLLVQMPAEALNCYGPKPCAGSEAAMTAARTVAAERLVTFTDSVVNAAATPFDSYACEAHVDINMEALRALEVVDIGNLIVSQPQNNMMCYNTPCPEDFAAASQANHTRAAQLESIAISLPKL